MFIWLQKLIPQHGLSRFLGLLAEKRNISYLKNKVIAAYIRHYGVNMGEALVTDYRDYECFNDFFTRRLKPNARTYPTDETAIISPVDGCISEIGRLHDSRLLQAKNIYYELDQLLGNNNHADCFHEGSFMTAYLAPGDYHRIHMPIDGQLLEMVHIPGKLFSVNPYTTSHIPQLFGINERVVCYFQTPIGKMAVVAIGAVIVGGIFMSWHGTVTPPSRHNVQRWNYEARNIQLNRAEELGYFKLGSTVIVLFEKNKVAWESHLQAGSRLLMGQKIADRI